MYGLYVYERNVCLFLKNILYRLHCAVIATLIKAGKEEATRPSVLTVNLARKHFQLCLAPLETPHHGTSI